MRELAKAQWQSYFDRLAPLLRASVVEVEATGLRLGPHVAADWVRLAEVSYDPAADLLEIAAHGGERRIAHPAKVRVREDDGCLQSIEVLDGHGGHEVVIFRQPLRLPQRAA